MSHFTTLVILPKEHQLPLSESDVEPIIAKLIARYDENVCVERYQRACYCIGSKAKRRACEHADATIGTIDAFRTRFNAMPENKSVDYFSLTKQEAKKRDKAWSSFIAPWTDAMESALALDAEKDAADPCCDNCHGSGSYTSTYNKDAKWDWWTIGGRWSGSLTEDHRDIFPLTDLKRDWSCFAIVTPDGAWNAEANMGWWAMTSDEDNDWPQKMYEIASAYPDHVGVLCDVHI